MQENSENQIVLDENHLKHVVGKNFDIDAKDGSSSLVEEKKRDISMIYADYNGSAPICGDVKDYLIKRLESGPFANPNAIHHMGQKVNMGMENARALAARKLGAKPNQCFFNSGSTEGISTVYYSILDEGRREGRDLIITSGIEHSAILNVNDFYQESKGYRVETVKTQANGQVDVQDLERILKENSGKVALVSIMAANNETGVIQPIKEIVAACRKNDAMIFSDTTQLIGKDHFDFDDSDLDFAIMSGHKIGALTGTGMILAKDPTLLKEFIKGGGQEKGLRGGTQNYLGNETIAVAIDYFEKNLSRVEELRKKREDFEAKVKAKYPQVVIMGEDAPRLASTTYISYPGIHGQGVQIELESERIYVTTSSACSDNEPATSKVLKAMGISDDIGRGVVRISLGLCSPIEWYDKILESLCNAYEKLEKIKSY